MEHLTEITVEELQQALDEVGEKTPTQRLIAAIAYKNGVTQTELAEWFDVERKTIYNWLRRFEERDLESAIRDENRPGRPRKITADQFDELSDVLHEPPREHGYDAPAWTTGLVQEYIQQQFGIKYSKPSCRRLMKEAGLSYQTPRQAAVRTDHDDQDSFEEEQKKRGNPWIPT